MSIDFDRFWKVEDGKFYLTEGGKTIELVESYLLFPGSAETLELPDVEKLASEEEVTNKILSMKGSWSVVYFNEKLRKIFIGRDIFGRQSLVIQPKLRLIGVRVDLDKVPNGWIEVPFGQVTVMSLDSDKVSMYTYFEQYPEGLLDDYFENCNVNVVTMKRELLTVSRQVLGDFESLARPEELYETVVEATKNLLKNEEGSHVGVCLSGGVDSTFIAHVVQKCLPDDVLIDLINVAFGNSDIICSQAPDRSRAIKALESLRLQYPNRQFRLILVNVNADELEKERKSFITLAARPATSVLDDSLACVLWFALRAKGIDYDNKEHNVTSPAKTLLLGSGADELLAGYARHRTRFEKEGNQANIAEECENELRRLGSRNGGRDARVAAQLGKNIMSPLLEDDVVSYLNNLPVTAKWDLSLPRGIGEKRILREAVKILGSPHDAPKQAMQFGSRMAKMSNNGDNSIKGSHKSPHLLNDE